VRARFPSREAFDAVLARSGITEAHVREAVRENLRIRAYIAQRFTGAESEVRRLMLIDEWVAGLMMASSPYMAGVYGQYLVMEHIHGRFPLVKLWQTTAWSNRQVSDHINVLQGGRFIFDSINCDHDVAVTADLGQWAPFVPLPPPPQLEVQDMFIIKVTAPKGQAWEGTRTFTYSGATLHHIVSGTDEAAHAKVLPVVPASWEQFLAYGGAMVPP